jgi:hypothetical protein
VADEQEAGKARMAQQAEQHAQEPLAPRSVRRRGCAGCATLYYLAACKLYQSVACCISRLHAVSVGCMRRRRSVAAASCAPSPISATFGCRGLSGLSSPGRVGFRSCLRPIAPAGAGGAEAAGRGGQGARNHHRPRRPAHTVASMLHPRPRSPVRGLYVAHARPRAGAAMQIVTREGSQRPVSLAHCPPGCDAASSRATLSSPCRSPSRCVS